MMPTDHNLNLLLKSTSISKRKLTKSKRKGQEEGLLTPISEEQLLIIQMEH